MLVVVSVRPVTLKDSCLGGGNIIVESKGVVCWMAVMWVLYLLIVGAFGMESVSARN